MRKHFELYDCGLKAECGGGARRGHLRRGGIGLSARSIRKMGRSALDIAAWKRLQNPLRGVKVANPRATFSTLLLDLPKSRGKKNSELLNLPKPRVTNSTLRSQTREKKSTEQPNLPKPSLTFASLLSELPKPRTR